MNGERHETVVIGAGQAGLAVGHQLARHGREFVILDGNDRIGDNWRSHWDSLRLYSPARYDGLPGMRFPAPGWSFPGKDQVADYLQAYAERFRLPVRTGVRVTRLSRADTGGPDGGGGWIVDTDGGRLLAENAVVATGTFGRGPYVPPFAPQLDPRILQLHSCEYRNERQLHDGPVLVVGASHSGADVAYEVAGRHRTVLCGRETGQIPLTLEARSTRLAFPVLWQIADRVLTMGTPLGRRMREEVRSHGGPLLRVKAADLARAGVERVPERMAGVRGGMPVLAGGRVVEVANVVWCTGFRQDFGWIDAPVTGPDGWPLEHRGVAEDAPGLYFCGLSFQRAFSSMLIGGAGRDAAVVAKHIAARERRLHRAERREHVLSAA
ncbi:flavin-containing monooxygenase [Kitasatospora sp. DSM 101779]|uniref:flavin-containing monooxygenase n=1 Tax=Kitasatospora sp. DSM 101779 TaxID=2853165 RepID=UPI0021D85658|nr:NAD(P)/FAD-dependent oxidoreductase [Kitasatospora sp. DSM 101779]MCU7821240.1 NAD(P)/FAD-dependent oxidoreductase [Kitasatospora sp. DSM 101779]